MAYPDDLKYTKDHEWLRLSGNVATVGITQFAQEALGDVVYVELPKVGEALSAGKPFGVVESTKAVSELFAPVDGKVLEINGPLVDAPETLNKDPYQQGWLVKLEVAAGSSADLMDAVAYTKYVAEQTH